jgi:hypothetical protein
MPVTPLTVNSTPGLVANVTNRRFLFVIRHFIPISRDPMQPLLLSPLLVLQLHTTHRSGDLLNRPSALGSVGQLMHIVDWHALGNRVMKQLIYALIHPFHAHA